MREFRVHSVKHSFATSSESSRNMGLPVRRRSPFRPRSPFCTATPSQTAPGSISQKPSSVVRPPSRQGRVYQSGRAEISPDVQLYAKEQEVLGTGEATMEYPRRYPSTRMRLHSPAIAAGWRLISRLLCRPQEGCHPVRRPLHARAARFSDGSALAPAPVRTAPIAATQANPPPEHRRTPAQASLTDQR